MRYWLWWNFMPRLPNRLLSYRKYLRMLKVPNEASKFFQTCRNFYFNDHWAYLPDKIKLSICRIEKRFHCCVNSNSDEPFLDDHPSSSAWFKLAKWTFDLLYFSSPCFWCDHLVHVSRLLLWHEEFDELEL